MLIKIQIILYVGIVKMYHQKRYYAKYTISPYKLGAYNYPREYMKMRCIFDERGGGGGWGVVRVELYESLKWCFSPQWRHRFQRWEARLVKVGVLKFAGRYAGGREHFASANHLTRKRRAKEGECLLCGKGIPYRAKLSRDQLQRPRNHANTFHRKLRSRCAPLAVPHFLFALT